MILFLAAASEFSDELLESYIDGLNTYSPDLRNLGIVLPTALGPFLTNFLRSDHANFWAADIPALMITDGSEFRKSVLPHFE